MTEHTIGIDISKSCLDAFRLEDRASARFENEPRQMFGDKFLSAPSTSLFGLCRWECHSCRKDHNSLEERAGKIR
jgi:hypothetical protein